MFDTKLLIITSIQASNNRQELENKIGANTIIVSEVKKAP